MSILTPETGNGLSVPPKKRKIESGAVHDDLLSKSRPDANASGAIAESCIAAESVSQGAEGRGRVFLRTHFTRDKVMID